MRKNLMRLLLTGVIVSFGLLPVLVTQAQQQVSDAQVAAMVEALRRAAPQTNSPNDGLYSEWKVQPETLKGWSRYCLKQELTPTQFEKTAIARKVVSCITRRELDKQLHATKNNETAAVRTVACWWMTGNYTGCNSGFTSDYVQKVVGFYQQQRREPS
ncbi:MAG: hypothetical protein DSM106950_05150 [Stigonema ocellatum SAG 48.90 = DSM 106950]|nr:hypothetical protein [Stigonema ocellatum SAG 48.90 = DSM 106950]